MFKNLLTGLMFSFFFSYQAESITLSYQGHLTINNRQANQNIKVTFELYDDKHNGNFIDSFTIDNLKVIDGDLNALIEFENLDKLNRTLWIEVHAQLLNDTNIFKQLLPRIGLSSRELNQHNKTDSSFFSYALTDKKAPLLNPAISLKTRSIGLEDTTINSISLTNTKQSEMVNVTESNSKSFDASLKHYLTDNEFKKVRHLHDSLREIIDAKFSQRIPSNLKNYIQKNGRKLSESFNVLNNQLQIDVTTGANPEAMINSLEQISGITINAVASTPSFSIISILSDAESIFQLSQIPTLKSAVPVIGSGGRVPESYNESRGFENKSNQENTQSRSQGAANNQAEQAMQVDAVRRVFPDIDGSGITVGTLSDSFSMVDGGRGDSQSTNDLPDNSRLTVISDSLVSTVIDEGRAMMEHIHDISPNLSTLGFATAKGGEAAFASSITALSNINMDIINDDWVYYAEPFYQDGVVAQAVDSYVNQGGIYVSLNHNFGNLSYENIFSDTNGDTRHNYAAGDNFLQFTNAPGGNVYVVLQWAQPWGNATTDLDLEIWNDAPIDTILFSSTTINVGGNPLEIVEITNTSGSAYNANIVVKRVSGKTANLTFKVIVFDNGAQSTINQFINQAAGTITPHAATPKSIAIGASPWFTTPTVAESFSGRGPHRRFFDTQGNAVGPFTFDKPDFMGVDKANTTFFGMDINNDADNLPNFSGTSAATPNAAAVVALMLQAAGGPGVLDYNDVKESLRMSAIDNGADGFDTTFGNGNINALGAVALAKGPSNIENYLYLDQYGNASSNQNLFNTTDVDTFAYASNVSGTTTLDITESDMQMDPMVTVFVPEFDFRIGVDYGSGTEDNALFAHNSATLFPYVFEVLTETDFTGAADFTASVDAPDQNVTNRTVNLDNNGHDNLNATLITRGDFRFYEYTAPTSGNLNVQLTTNGFNGMLRIYSLAGPLLDFEITANNVTHNLDIDNIFAGNRYFISVTPNRYLGSGSFNLNTSFDNDDTIFSNGFE